MAIDKVNFHVYADGKQRILVIDNCIGETLEAFNRILSMVCDLPAGNVKQVPAVAEETANAAAPVVENLKVEQSFTKCILSTNTEDPKVHLPEFVLECGPYAGMTPLEAVSQDGIKAVTSLCEYSREIEQESVRKRMIDCCKHIISLDLASRPDETADIEALTEFFDIYRQLLGAQCLKTLQLEYGVDLDDAVQSKDTAALSRAYCSVISDLRNRTKA